MFSKINDSIYTDEDFVYKPFSYVISFLKERRRNVHFLLQNELKHSPRIIKEVIENDKIIINLKIPELSEFFFKTYKRRRYWLF